MVVSRRLQSILYWTSLGFLVIIMIGFIVVMPIDAILQSRQTNLALNTFIIVGACSLFVIFAIILYTIRVVIARQSLADIPKKYVPRLDDFPKECADFITEEYERCKTIWERAGPHELISHPGLSNPTSELLPGALPYEDVVRSVGERVVWRSLMTLPQEQRIPRNRTFRYVAMTLSSNKDTKDHGLWKEYLKIYERLRFSGKAITEEEFLRFMEITVSVIKASIQKGYAFGSLNPQKKEHSTVPSGANSPNYASSFKFGITSNLVNEEATFNTLGLTSSDWQKLTQSNTKHSHINTSGSYTSFDQYSNCSPELYIPNEVSDIHFDLSHRSDLYRTSSTHGSQASKKSLIPLRTLSKTSTPTASQSKELYSSQDKSKSSSQNAFLSTINSNFNSLNSHFHIRTKSKSKSKSKSKEIYNESYNEHSIVPPLKTQTCSRSRSPYDKGLGQGFISPLFIKSKINLQNQKSSISLNSNLPKTDYPTTSGKLFDNDSNESVIRYPLVENQLPITTSFDHLSSQNGSPVLPSHANTLELNHRGRSANVQNSVLENTQEPYSSSSNLFPYMVYSSIHEDTADDISRTQFKNGYNYNSGNSI